MGMKVPIGDDYFDVDIIAFVRKLKKTIVSKASHGPARTVSFEYVVQLKPEYSLDAKGQVSSIFLTKEAGEGLLKYFKEEVTERVNKGARPL